MKDKRTKIEKRYEDSMWDLIEQGIDKDYVCDLIDSANGKEIK